MSLSFKHQQIILTIKSILLFLLKWTICIIPISFLAGSASALLLVSLEWVTNYRESHLWIIALLPIAGFTIGAMYHYWGGDSSKGNNLLIEEVHSPTKSIPFRMAPLVYIGTVLTHLFGGSSGREGTAVQMGGAIADQFSRWFDINSDDRRMIIIAGISAGFASVFGAPLAGAIFAIEVLILKKVRYKFILISFLAAFAGNYTCHHIWQVTHANYDIPIIPEISMINLSYTLLVGILCGLAALLFSQSLFFWTNISKRISYPPLRPFTGGIIIALTVWMMGTTKFIGLGVPTIMQSFTEQQDWYDFLIKILLTTFTLGVGFKGGEVTPLFFIGATLGSALFGIIPLPMALLAAMGFVAVFSGAANTPITCSLMGIELFGLESGLYITIACVTAYLFSGHTGIYTSQPKTGYKHRIYKKIKSKKEAFSIKSFLP